MAWYNPSTWSFVDRLQGQAPAQQPKNSPGRSLPYPEPVSGDVNKVVGYLNGRGYNFAGDWVDGPKTSSVTQDDSAWRSSLESQLRDLRMQAAQQPKLAQFDVMENWRQARAKAEQAVNPLYERKLNNFLERNLQLKQRQQEDTANTIENINTEKTNTLETNQVARTRTAEDTVAAIDKINTQEGNYQVDEGQDFDTNYRATAEQLASSSNTGLGRQAVSDMVRLRNVTNQRQLDEFNGQRQAKELFKTRTFEDLLRGDEQATKLAESKTKAANFNLDSYLEDLAYDEKVQRDLIEAERIQSVLNESTTQRDLGVESFLAGLVNNGYSAQDIAYNRQVYA